MKWISYLGLVAALACTVIPDDAFATTRADAVNKADTDNNKRLDGKELRSLKKAHPQMRASLKSFCKNAKAAPKKMGVDLPPNATGKQKQCGSCHVARPFVLAWIDRGEGADNNNDGQRRPTGTSGGGGSPTERTE